MPILGEGFSVHVTGSSHDEYGKRQASVPEAIDKIVRTISEKIRAHTTEISTVQKLMLDDADIALVAYGSCARTAEYVVKHAREKAIRAGLLRLVGLWPFPRETVQEALRSVAKVIVLENNLGQIFPEVERVTAEGSEILFLPPETIGTLHRPAYVLEHVLEVAA